MFSLNQVIRLYTVLCIITVSAVLLWGRGEELKSCTLNDLKLYGRVQVVKSFPDIKVQVVNSFPDLKVESVQSFPEHCGQWEFVESFPDFKILYVDSFPDLKIQFVDSFPGIP